MRLGRYPEAEQCFKAARSLAEAGQDRQLAAATMLNLANIARVKGDASSAIQYAREALRPAYLAEGNRQGQVQLLQTLGSIAVESGDVDEAEDWVGRAAEILPGPPRLRSHVGQSPSSRPSPRAPW